RVALNVTVRPFPFAITLSYGLLLIEMKKWAASFFIYETAPFFLIKTLRALRIAALAACGRRGRSCRRKYHSKQQRKKELAYPLCAV
ncbi:hypothetical protein ACTJJ0_24060, partial [Chitinophaga sp. 22321]|uniref:hypothetical protein n=1 Tax=Chitinophaga sp. 22321 TaxID=3453909 RepID=UPI003F87FADD